MSVPPVIAGKHTWNFFRTGGLDQAAITTGSDLLDLENLDQKLWVALSCPVKGLEIDEATLTLIDADKDGRIRAPELITAIKWAARHVRDAGELLKGKDVLALDAINDATPEGKAVLVSAKGILRNLDKPEATMIALADVLATTRVFAGSRFNGDGIITASSTDDPELKQVIADVIATLGGETDRSGLIGVNQQKLDTFFTACLAYTRWRTVGTTPEVLTIGAFTPFAASTVAAVKAKADDYFGRCRLAAFDHRALTALNRQETEYIALTAKDLKITADEIAGFPLARIEKNTSLPLFDGVNPAWAAALTELHKHAVTPVFGAEKTALTEADWIQLKSKVANYEAWLAAKAGSEVEPLGFDRASAILNGTTKDKLTGLIAEDKALEPEVSAIGSLAQLLRYVRDLRTITHNFVNFVDFYSRDYHAVFQAGTLYLDSRACHLCIRVEDPAAHIVLASLSRVYIAYVDCKRPITGEAIKIAACFTQGDSDYLIVGRNGLFYDRKGRDWDATIVKINDNPISIGQAFWSPYKKFIRFIEDQVAKRAAAADAESTNKLATVATTTVNIDKTKPEPKKIDVGTVAALGVGAGAILGTATTLATGMAHLSVWQVPLVIIGLIAIISGPSMLIAWLKLRQRTLGPILDANGWAINGRIKINFLLGNVLTQKASLPTGSRLSLNDPYEDKQAAARRRNAIIWMIIFAIVVGLVTLKVLGKWPFAPGEDDMVYPHASISYPNRAA